jgi:4-alpha-glucanotransferase
MIGDVPFFVPHDSADVWANQELFELGLRGRPRRVAGVPPDIYSKTGQLWGFPLYRWDRMRERNHDWWLARFRAAFERFDAVRIDHFIGFHRAWAVPGRARTALRGRWVLAPGAELFERLRAEHGTLELIAEDLGIVTPEVEALRDRYELPGIRVLHFAFDGDPNNPHLPHRYPPRCVAATGTHDNDTSRGWFQSLEDPWVRDRVLRYLGCDGREIHWDMIRSVMVSQADTAILPAQDIAGLGTEGRMNRPGLPTGNWEWRLRPDALTDDLTARFRGLTEASGRLRRT